MWLLCAYLRRFVVNLNLNKIAIYQVVGFAKFDVCSDLDDGLGMTAEACVGAVGAQQKRVPSEDAAGQNLDADRTAIILFFKAQAAVRHRVGLVESDVE